MAISYIRRFIQLESAGGILLFATAILALILDNSPFSGIYESILNMNVSFHIGQIGLSKPLILWINEGLMAIFFLSVGLEIKRELVVGELNSISKVSLPIIAAIGGMALPALIYIVINGGDAVSFNGWAIPTATDIAFSLGVLSLLGKRVPLSIKTFLTAIAIFDDIGAILIIAAYYTYEISVLGLSLAGLCLVLLYWMNRFHVRRQEAYFIVGIVLWVCVLKSGVHATLAGVAVALAIPMTDPRDPTKSPLLQLEKRLVPWVAFLVLPIFAFANAGVSFSGLELSDLLLPLPLGIALGLFVGKTIGIMVASWLGVKSKLARMPTGANWLSILGVSAVCGIGFTMSLFIGALAFSGFASETAALIRIGVLTGSICSGMLGYYILTRAYPKNAS